MSIELLHCGNTKSWMLVNTHTINSSIAFDDKYVLALKFHAAFILFTRKPQKNFSPNYLLLALHHNGLTFFLEEHYKVQIFWKGLKNLKKNLPLCFDVKVHIFWEGHKFLRNLHRRFVLCSNGQIYGGDFSKFCFLLRIYELY